MNSESENNEIESLDLVEWVMMIGIVLAMFGL